MVYHRLLCRQLQCSEQLCCIANWQAHLTVNHQGIRAQILVYLDVLCSNSGNNVLRVWRTAMGLVDSWCCIGPQKARTVNKWIEWSSQCLWTGDCFCSHQPLYIAVAPQVSGAVGKTRPIACWTTDNIILLPVLKHGPRSLLLM